MPALLTNGYDHYPPAQAAEFTPEPEPEKVPSTIPKNPRSRNVARSIAPTLKSLKTVIMESWSQRPEPAGLLRRRSTSRESTASTRTRAASLEKLQTRSIKSRTSIVGKYQVEQVAGSKDKG